jgi:hypothetical protein
MEFKRSIKDGKEHMSVVVEFDLGEIKDQVIKTELSNQSYTVGMGIKTSMMILKESIRTAILREDYENYDKYLEEYSRLYLNDAIGVIQYPIMKDENGEIVGIKKDAKVVGPNEV